MRAVGVVVRQFAVDSYFECGGINGLDIQADVLDVGEEEIVLVSVSGIYPAAVRAQLEGVLGCSQRDLDAADVRADPFPFGHHIVGIGEGHVEGCCRFCPRIIVAEYDAVGYICCVVRFIVSDFALKLI